MGDSAMLGLTLLLVLSPSPTTVDFPNQSQKFDSSGAAKYELAIVRYGRRLGYEKREYHSVDGKEEVRCAIDDAELLDSTIESPKSIHIVTPVSGTGNCGLEHEPSAQLRSLRRGVKYLLLTSKPLNGELRFPQGTVGFAGETGFNFISSKAPQSEVIGLAAIETDQTKLKKQLASTADRCMINLALVLGKAREENARQVCYLLGISELGHFRYQEKPYLPTQMLKVPLDAPWLAIMREAANSQTDRIRARIGMVMTEWGIPGGAELLYAAIKKTINDPLLFMESGDFITSNNLIGRAVFGGALTQEDFQRPNTELFDLAFSAKSPVVQRILLSNCSRMPDLSRKKRFLALADASDESLSMLLFRRIAMWYADSVHVPDFRQQGTDFRARFLNRGELSKYWHSIIDKD
jgi:hypothetical protein